MIELMIDSTTGHEALSFMDCMAGYNQIQMAPEDEKPQLYTHLKASVATK